MQHAGFLQDLFQGDSTPSYFSRASNTQFLQSFSVSSFQIFLGFPKDHFLSETFLNTFFTVFSSGIRPVHRLKFMWLFYRDYGIF